MLDNIRKLCKDRGITVETLEEKAGMSKNSIYRWDRVSPAVKYVVSVSEILGVSVDTVLGRISDRELPNDLEWCLNGLNEDGIRMVVQYANFILSQPQYKKYNFNGSVEKSS